MSQERKKIEVWIFRWDDPESKLKAELGRLSEDESKEAVLLKVDAGNCGGVDKVDRIAKALVRLSRPHWRLVLWIGFCSLESVPESVWNSQTWRSFESTATNSRPFLLPSPNSPN